MLDAFARKLEATTAHVVADPMSDRRWEIAPYHNWVFDRTVVTVALAAVVTTPYHSSTSALVESTTCECQVATPPPEMLVVVPEPAVRSWYQTSRSPTAGDTVSVVDWPLRPPPWLKST